MSYIFYKILHLGSLFALCLLLGALWGLYIKSPSPDKKIRKLLLAGQGLALLFIFIAGFALIAKTKIPSPWPFWIYGKLVIWLLLGASPFVIRKAGQKWAPLKSSLALFGLFILFLGAVLLVALR